MNKLYLKNTKTLTAEINTKIFAGDNLITKINVQLPDNIGGYPKRECEFNLRAIIPEGNMSYIINPNEPYFYITNDITETAQTVKLMMIITHAGNAIGRTNTVDLQVREPAEAPDPPLTPREEFDEVIAEQRAEIAEQAETISAQDETITQQTEQITELNGEVSTLEGTVAEQQATITRQNTTIDELNERRTPVYIQPSLESKEIVPKADTRYYAPSEGKDGFSSVKVDGATVEALGLNENYYKHGEPFLDKVGTYHPFPENSYGGIYFTKLNEDDFPVGIKVVNYDYNYNIFSIPALNINTLRNNIKSFILLNCKNVKIGSSLFTGASLLTICQLDGVLTIGTGAFDGCTSLTELDFPDSLTSIGDFAFQGCSGLTEVNFPNSLTRIGQNTFINCSGLTNLTLAQGFNCNGLNLWWSTRLTTETIAACLEALADRTGQTAYTITFGATNINKLTAEQKAIATNKNWNLA